MATGSGPQLVDALEQARPLADVLIDERLANLPPVEAALAAAPVIAAQPVDAWEPAVHTVAERIGVDADVIRSSVAAFIRAWNNDPARLADQQLGLTTQVRDRLTAAANAHRWATLVSRIDPRLVTDPHWRTLAAALHDAHTRRVDVPDAIYRGPRRRPPQPGRTRRRPRQSDGAHHIPRTVHPRRGRTALGTSGGPPSQQQSEPRPESHHSVTWS